MLFLEDRIKEFLERFFETTQRPIQSLLFYGPEGGGKKTVALAFAQALLCENKIKSWSGCGQCANCLRFQKGLQPDFLLLEPQDNKYEIETIRQAIEFLSYEPQFSSLRILIIDEADRLREDSQNTLLKTLEEPPENALIILITAFPHKLLPTIRSRVLSLRFPRLSSQILKDFLMQNYHLESSEAELITLRAEGKIGLAIKLLDKDFQKKQENYLLILKKILKSSFPAQSQIIQKITKDKGTLRVLIENWLEILHWDLQNTLQQKPTLLNLPLNAQITLAKELIKALPLIFDYNTNPNLLLENIFLNYGS